MISYVMPVPWTPERVDDALVAAFRLRGGAVVPSAREVEAQLNWRRRFLDADPDGWTYLFARARCLAAGESVSALRAGRGWPRDRFERGWRRARATVVAGLNRERVNTAALLAGEAAETRLLERGRIQVVGAAVPLYTLTT